MKNKRPTLLSLVLPIITALALISLTGCTIIIGEVPEPPEEPPAEQLPPEEGPPSGEVQIAFTANRTELQPGECATLQWNVEGGFEVFLNEQPVERSGQMEVCPEETTSYWLGVDTGETIERREVVIAVAGAEGPPPEEHPPEEQPPPEEHPPEEQPPEGEGVEVINLFVEPDVIPAGGCATLHWEVIPPGEWPVFINDQEVPPVGEHEVCPATTTTYELRVEASGGPQTRTATLQVESEPEPGQPSEPTPAPPAGPAPTSPPSSGGPSADIRPSDLYADKQPHGTVWVRITNDGPDTLTNKKVEISGWGTAYLRTTAGGAPVSYPATVFTLNLAPGQTQTINLGWQIDTSLYKYDLRITATAKDFVDPNGGNNTYDESIVPTVPVATPTPPGAPPGGGSWGILTADLAVTDLYPDNQPQGKVFARITNNGPDSLSSANIQLSCSVEITDYISGAKTAIVTLNTITLSLNPGQTKAFDTGISVETNKYWYKITCDTQVPFKDPNAGNDSYTEIIPPPP